MAFLQCERRSSTCRSAYLSQVLAPIRREKISPLGVAHCPIQSALYQMGPSLTPPREEASMVLEIIQIIATNEGSECDESAFCSTGAPTFLFVVHYFVKVASEEPRFSYWGSESGQLIPEDISFCVIWLAIYKEQEKTSSSIYRGNCVVMLWLEPLELFEDHVCLVFGLR
ncbi:uncharacterized protein LOC130501351 [Raphanus sativus]|uniref:Uncharacterized protein LOC130499493 n=1 Tax=Raphanus sativus TaxID=3726 RepID=A0A9W3CDM3_RAPSA|nr:uncharacterized protein LOC130499493 [Raphanus sativus]XP_056849584.1 uncharacterized protein LOC130499493 [Raphanus sativus]XP_056852233.1 uncharacterized protein LOC130501351 [Raphanus sativus]XP_056852234.1 uncharacterized protein LOC130501351 [Raphanus sativus]